MDFLHCNNCGHHAHLCERRNYFLTSCGHVFCENCSSRIQDTCSVCRVTCRIVPVSQESKQNIKAFFMDPTSSLRDNYQRIQQNYQQVQQNYQETHQNYQQLIQVMDFQKTQIKSFTQQYAKLLENERVMKSEVEELRNEIKELNGRIEAFQLREQTFMAHGLMYRTGTPDQGRIVQQNVDPTFTNIFGPPQGRRDLGISRGNPTTNSSLMIASTGESKNSSHKAGAGSRPHLTDVTVPPSSMDRNQNYIQHYSRTASSLKSVTSTPARPIQIPIVPPSPPRPGVRLGHGQAQQRRFPAGSDIMARLKSLRW